jgi:hypothetical protein
MRASGNLLASELDDLDVRGFVAADPSVPPTEGAWLGEIDEAWVNCATGQLEYLTFEHEGRTLALPQSALTTKVDVTSTRLYYLIPTQVSSLAQAPAIDEEKRMVLENPEFRKSIDKFYQEHGKMKRDGAKRDREPIGTPRTGGGGR